MTDYFGIKSLRQELHLCQGVRRASGFRSIRLMVLSAADSDVTIRQSCGCCGHFTINSESAAKDFGTWGHSSSIQILHTQTHRK